MKWRTGHEIRRIWLDFFKSKNHAVEPGASLVPISDPTLLWINSGVAALKDYFDGSRMPANPRIVNAQKCIRTNDIEHVGKTARHHTFFEMLGNFSIGDYFRDEALAWAFELLTDKDKGYGFDKKRLYMTVYPDDEETKKKWRALGVEEGHIIENSGNFWEIGTGPCGPCTEVFYDRGDAYGEDDLRLIAEDIENDRYIEVWNIVFSQFNAKQGLDREAYPELPSKNIDTGMGLERMACIIQGRETNFESDLFFPVIKHISKIAHRPYDGSMSFKIIADHMRAVVFAMNDGATLSNDGRGYVLRRLLRRAVKHGRQLGIDRPFLKELVDSVVKMMEEGYPELGKTVSFTKTVVEKEETKFLETLSQGEKILEGLLEKDDIVSGKDAFTLYDTYGFPLELTMEIAQARGARVDQSGFRFEMRAQQDRARSARKAHTSMKDQNEAYLAFKTPSAFVGYETTTAEARVVRVFEDGVVFDKTPFYAESGGQISDVGVVKKDGESYHVADVERLPNGQHLHIIEDHALKEGDRVELRVDEERRQRIMAHHSATHLLYETLRECLGSHVSQQGSHVGPDYLRFDFNHVELPDEKTVLDIERRVNEKIAANEEVAVEHGTLEEAEAKGAIAEFGEKYDSRVRMVHMSGTLDLCGGTHVEKTGDIERFAIAGVETKGSGIYRITALAKDRVFAIEDFTMGVDENLEQLRNKIGQLSARAEASGIELDADLPEEPQIRGTYQDILDKRTYAKNLQQTVKRLEKSFAEQKSKAAMTHLEKYLSQAEEGKIVLKTAGLDPKSVKDLADGLMERMKEGLVFIANEASGKLFLVAKSKGDIHAGELVKKAAQIAGGGGGGRPDFAQAGARDIGKIDDVIRFVKEKTA